MCSHRVVVLKKVSLSFSVDVDSSSAQSGSKPRHVPQMSQLPHRPAITRPHTARAALQKHHPHHTLQPCRGRSHPDWHQKGLTRCQGRVWIVCYCSLSFKTWNSRGGRWRGLCSEPHSHQVYFGISSIFPWDVLSLFFLRWSRYWKQQLNCWNQLPFK